MSRKFLFEHKHEPLLPLLKFVTRMIICAGTAILFLGFTLLIGTLALHQYEHQSWLDAMLNTVMVITGIGLQGTIETPAGKTFMIFFSFLGAVTFYSTIGILFSPLIHRFLHAFHLNNDTTD